MVREYYPHTLLVWGNNQNSNSEVQFLLSYVLLSHLQSSEEVVLAHLYRPSVMALF